MRQTASGLFVPEAAAEDQARKRALEEGARVEAEADNADPKAKYDAEKAGMLVERLAKTPAGRLLLLRQAPFRAFVDGVVGHVLSANMAQMGAQVAMADRGQIVRSMQALQADRAGRSAIGLEVVDAAAYAAVLHDLNMVCRQLPPPQLGFQSVPAAGDEDAAVPVEPRAAADADPAGEGTRMARDATPTRREPDVLDYAREPAALLAA